MAPGPLTPQTPKQPRDPGCPILLGVSIRLQVGRAGQARPSPRPPCSSPSGCGAWPLSLPSLWAQRPVGAGACGQWGLQEVAGGVWTVILTFLQHLAEPAGQPAEPSSLVTFHFALANPPFCSRALRASTPALCFLLGLALGHGHSPRSPWQMTLLGPVSGTPMSQAQQVEGPVWCPGLPTWKRWALRLPPPLASGPPDLLHGHV